MKRIAILGGGIAGLAAAYECELQRLAGADLDWHLFEAGDRFGGTVETTRLGTPEGEWILEGGPDAWVTGKRWAHDLAVELGLADQVIPSNDAARRTYIAFQSLEASPSGRHLVAMPQRMRMMVPEDLATLEESPLFSASAKRAYAEELARAEELKRQSPFTDPGYDESVAGFVLRHFGEEVLEKIGAPLLSGVFGGDTARLGVRAVMPAFVAMEQEHGSLTAALQAKAAQRQGERDAAPPPTFTTLRSGMGSLVEALLAKLPPERLHLGSAAVMLKRAPAGTTAPWLVRFDGADANACAIGFVPFDEVLCALPLDAARALLEPVSPVAAALLPRDASSAVLVTFCWPAESAATFRIPPGFGFLVPQDGSFESSTAQPAPQLLAATFTAQKFDDRVPAGARAIRVFFGTGSAEAFAAVPDRAVEELAFTQLQSLLGRLPTPEASLTTVRRWPRSLPQYEVGHLTRMAELDRLVAELGHLSLLGNGYRGVGVPDLIRDARAAARALAGKAPAR